MCVRCGRAMKRRSGSKPTSTRLDKAVAQTCWAIPLRHVAALLPPVQDGFAWRAPRETAARRGRGATDAGRPQDAHAREAVDALSEAPARSRGSTMSGASAQAADHPAQVGRRPPCARSGARRWTHSNFRLPALHKRSSRSSGLATSSASSTPGRARDPDLGPPGVGDPPGLASLAAGRGRIRVRNPRVGHVRIDPACQGRSATCRTCSRCRPAALLVVGRIGYLPVSQDGAVLFFPAHATPATNGFIAVLTSKEGFDEWGGSSARGGTGRRAGDPTGWIPPRAASSPPPPRPNDPVGVRIQCATSSCSTACRRCWRSSRGPARD